MFKREKEGKYQYGDWLYAMLVMLQIIAEEHQSFLMQHSIWNKTPTV